MCLFERLSWTGVSSGCATKSPAASGRDVKHPAANRDPLQAFRRQELMTRPGDDASRRQRDARSACGLIVAETSCVIHEGAGVVKGRLAVFDVGVRDWCADRRDLRRVWWLGGFVAGRRCRGGGLGLAGRALWGCRGSWAPGVAL